MSDLRFSGLLLPGADPRRARLQLTAFFRLRDPAAVEPFFAGRAVTLRRDLHPAEAEALCARLRTAGLDCAVLPTPAAPAPEPEPEAEPPPGSGADIEPAPAAAMATAGAEAPNLFQVRPDRDEPPDPETVQLRWLASLIATVTLGVALLAAVIAAGRWTPSPAVVGPLASSVDRAGQLYLLTADALLVHDRAGHGLGATPAAALGLTALAGPLLTLEDGTVVLRGRAAEDASATTWRCRVLPARCEPLTGETVGTLRALVDAGRYGGVHALSDNALLWIEGGAVRAERPLAVAAARPRLINAAGLLVAKLDPGPLVGIYRPDPEAFGQQLDAPLLLIPGAVDDSTPWIRDLARVGNRWWVLAGDPGSKVSLHAFDNEWAHRATVPVTSDGDPQQIQPWGGRLLLLDPGRPSLQRLDTRGVAGAPFTSTLLETERERQLSALHWQRRGAGTALVATALAFGAALLALLLARGDRWRAGRTAAPALSLEREGQRFHWHPALAGAREHRALAGTGVAALLAAGAAATAVTGAPAPALLLAAAAAGCAGVGAACALPPGHIGERGNDWLLVDHRGVYQGAGAGEIARRGNTLLRGGVALHLGSRWLPAFPPQLASRIADSAPAAPAPVIAAALLRAGHPAALGLAGSFLCLLAAVSVAVL